ncbi:hypothetical protein [Mucilaginibacter celer]|uniref:hypothetical protein n=1 Tax=Mucilaginibacter celer TaxID=2305508 RepID=UPI0013CE5502|nr:hypothetical protein [Mucilaginibacter celer]
MTNKDMLKLVEIADIKLKEVKTMTKKRAILSLNKSGILTKKASLPKLTLNLKN